MYRALLFCFCLFIVPFSTAVAAGKSETAKESAVKELSGMSIVGNDEAPKALYIVPWKRSEIGMETSLSMMLTESAAPVDRDVFMRQLRYFEAVTGQARKE